eukprot:CAMPEP_0117018904 /NCGR_PEP_ID=MMETSP0472-20121206/14567_1 /TAXON_ID=693140 ORGANISM="Tiarina fusus, Strain LIS" /NCGR_SAMPLE_ID=MMETSP0472 /ASSEMBLY_ACC=CAM_ASM_000603 /LENGTH=129 /DNA_ID=CAMNT_0004723705 /DNA_START=340 /DNA_END=726 /DNA_ORIENTATION=-
MAVSLHHEGMSSSKIAHLTGIKENIILRYTAAYDDGLKQGKDISVYSGKRIADGLACECLGAIIANRRAKISTEDPKPETCDSPKNSDGEDAEDSGDEDAASNEDEEMKETEVIDGIKTTIDLNCLIPW